MKKSQIIKSLLVSFNIDEQNVAYGLRILEANGYSQR